MLADATGRGIPETGTTTFRPPLCAGVDCRDGRGGPGRGLCAAALPDLRSGQPRPGRADDRGGAVVSAQLFPEAGRDDLARGLRPRGAHGARRRSGWPMSRPWARSTFRARMRRGFWTSSTPTPSRTLPVGRVRYGLMLREDGLVLDDGTTARLGENHYLMTTTTAAAGLVMRHLDFVHQAFCAGLAGAVHLGHRKLGAVRRGRAEGAGAGEFVPGGAGGAALHGRARRCGWAGWMGGCSASRSRARRAMRSPCRPAMARRCSATWWRGPRRWAAGPTGWRR